MPDEEKKTQDNTVSEPIKTTPEWTARQKFEADLRLKLRGEYEHLLAIWKQDELEGVRKEYEKLLQDGLKKAVEDWKAEQKPPSPEQIQELLSQDYIEFTVSLRSRNGNGQNENKNFTLQELPQEAELKFYSNIRSKLQNKIKELYAFDQENMGATFEDRFKSGLTLIDEGFTTLADTVVIVLNPFGEDKEITREWVQKNISTNRQWNIIEAQLMVNRVRDFFARLSLSGQSMMTMMTGQSFPQLQQLAR